MGNTLNVTVIGTGLMGYPMSQNVLKAGFPLKVWNRTAEKAAALVYHGAVLATGLSDAVRGADVVISMLTDGATTCAIVDDPVVQAALKSGAVWIDMTSAKPMEARAQAATLNALGVAHLDAPVSGGTRGAAEASLAIMVGGDADVFESMKPVLDAMGRSVHVGPSGAGQLCKLCNQTIVGITIGAVSEAMLLAEQGGADPAALRRALKGGFADSVILQQHGARMTTGDFEPGGLSQSQLKDMNNSLAEAANLNLTLPMTQSVRDRYKVLVDDMDGGRLDHAALYLELLRQNSIE